MRVQWLGVLVLMGAPALAQTQPASPPANRAEQGTQAGQPPYTEARVRRERLLKTVQLPRKADEVRAKGVPAGEMKEALDAARAKRLPAHEMSEVTDAQSKDIDQHGRIDNFGHFVKSKLNEGLRGRDLAAAIHEEHARRGMGKGHSKDKAAKDKADKDKRDKAGRPDDDDKGKPGDRDEDHGKKPKDKPDDKGKGKGKDKPRGKPGA